MKNCFKFKSFVWAAMLLIFTTQNVWAQEQTLLLKKISQNFDLKIKIVGCQSNGLCEGKAAISIFEKNASTPFQTIAVSNFFLDLYEPQKAEMSLIELDRDYYESVVFSDFNFDGAEDLALRIRLEETRGKPNFDVYVRSKTGNKFVKDTALTNLTSGIDEIFEADSETKTLETRNQKGCCWRQTIRYKFINNRPVKIYVQTEDGDGCNDTAVMTTEVLAPGKWRRTVKRVKRPYDLGYGNAAAFYALKEKCGRNPRGTRKKSKR